MVIFRDIDKQKKAQQEILHLKDEIAQKAETELAKELAATRLLQNVSSKLLEKDHIADLYEEIMVASKAIMNSDAVSMQMYIPETKQLKLIVWKGFHHEAAKFWDLVDAASGSTCGEALAKNQRIVVIDVEKEKFMQGTEDLKAYRLSGIRAVQSTPLVSRSGRIVGMISNHWYKVHQPTERDFNFLDVLARQLADQVENTYVEQALRESESKYRTLFETMGQGYADLEIIRGSDGRATDIRYLELNPQYERLEYWTEEQMRANNSGEITVVSDTQSDSRVSAESYAAVDMRSFITVPLARRGKFKFMISIVDNNPRQWRDDEIDLAKELTVRIWSRLEKARAEDAMLNGMPSRALALNKYNCKLSLVPLSYSSKEQTGAMIT